MANLTDQQRRRLTVGTAPDPASLKSGELKGKKLSELLMSEVAEEIFEKSIGKENKSKLISVHTTTDAEMKKKRSFAEKDKYMKTGKDDQTDPTKFDASKISEIVGGKVFFTCRKGLKPESPNQDSYVYVALPGKWALYGVFDGHGPNGHDVSDMAVTELCKKFLSTDDFITNTGPAFTAAFLECQRLIEEGTQGAKNKKGDGLVDASSSGSTCTMAFHNLESDILTIAHVGDSRGLLFRGDKAWRTDQEDEKRTKAIATGAQKREDGEVDIIYATEDHKPNLPGEKKRIEAKGGRVVFDGYYNYRVFAKAGMYPGLNMSRALGDVVAHKEAGLCAEPELKEIKLADERAKSKLPLTLIIASDGVWEFIANEQAPGFVTENAEVPGCPEKACFPLSVDQKRVEHLAKKSWDKWMADSDNEISDDITVIGVTL